MKSEETICRDLSRRDVVAVLRYRPVVIVEQGTKREPTVVFQRRPSLSNRSENRDRFVNELDVQSCPRRRRR